MKKDLLKSNFKTYHEIPDEYKDNKSVLINLLKVKGTQYDFFSDEIKKNKEIAIEALKVYPSALKSISNELKLNKKFILEVIKNKSITLNYDLLDGNFFKDINVCIESIKRDKRNMIYFVDLLKNKENLLNVLSYVFVEPYLRKEEFEELFQDTEVLKKIFKYPVEEISHILIKNEEVIEYIIDEKEEYLSKLNLKVENKELILKIIKKHPKFYFENYALKDDRECLTLFLKEIKDNDHSLFYHMFFFYGGELLKKEDFINNLLEQGLFEKMDVFLTKINDSLAKDILANMHSLHEKREREASLLNMLEKQSEVKNKKNKL